MSELREIFGKNLTELRKKNQMTQLELAEKLSYSDKAISKWEHGDALPSLENLVAICEFYGVTLDQLTHEGIEKQKDINSAKTDKTNKIIISTLSVILVWFIIVSLYVIGALFNIFYTQYYWQLFLFAIPISCVILIVFTAIWAPAKYIYPEVTILIWSFLACIYCSFLDKNLWMLFLLGIPAQLIVVFWSRLKIKRRKPEDKYYHQD
jgi:transcriptional regulator with XRE-family HTH domain